jgi:hypothetical protein
MQASFKIVSVISILVSAICLVACSEVGAPLHSSPPQVGAAQPNMAAEQAQQEAQQSRYRVQGNTVYDNKTDLTWARCSVGQRWEEDTGCVGIVSTMPWEQARGLESGGWRLPTRNELETIALGKYGDPIPLIDKVAFPDVDINQPTYWSRTTHVYNAARFWAFSFVTASCTDHDKGNANAVRLVRTGDFNTQSPTQTTKTNRRSGQTNQGPLVQAGRG